MPSREDGLLPRAFHTCHATLALTDHSCRNPFFPGRVAARILEFLLFILFLQTANALDPSRTIKQFDHSSWTVRLGASIGIVDLAQTTGGFLWLATPSGLVRFDGVTFEAFRPTTGPALPQSDISALMATVDGGLWIGYRLGGCSLLKHGVLTNYSFPEGTVWVWQLRASSRPSGDLASCLSAAAGDPSSQWPADFSLHVVGTPQPLLVDAFEAI